MELSGTVNHVTYHNAESHYTVLRLATNTGEVTVVGSFPSVAPGEELRLTGEWQAHPQYGRQFKALSQQRVLPATREGVLRFLGSGLIRGIGPAFARRLVDHFGVDVLRVIKDEPHRLAEVPGLGAQRSESLVQGIAAHRAVQDIMVFLQGLGITPSLAARIYKRYGNEAVDCLRRDPYRLADEVYGIGFRTADMLARNLGMPADSPERAKAAVLYRLHEAVQEGHMCLPLALLQADVARLLSVPSELSSDAVAELAATGRLVTEGEGESALVYLPRMHLAERETARLLADLAKTALSPQNEKLTLELDTESEEETSASPLSSTHFIDLSAEQSEAVDNALRNGVTVITGGPGTGKTTIVRSIIQKATANGRKVLLAAPTGRAAKRLHEATGTSAQTIHRLLEYGYSAEAGAPTFQRNAGNPLAADVIIVDEVSMLDVPLAHHLLQAIRPGTTLILVGDADQLPSVGPGTLLRDLIAAGCLPLQRLTTVFRQAQESMIVVNAHRINSGELPILNQSGKDFFIIEEEKPELLTQIVCELVSTRLPRFLDCDPLSDIQVLTPVRRGPAGVQNLNKALQQALNPRAAQLPAEQVDTLLPGDRVMQVRNNYEKMVFNGDIGSVVMTDSETGELQVAYQDRDEEPVVGYSGEDIEELTLAYATSIHKSQGSEFPVAVIVLPRVMPALMTRNLLYTAVTRARRLVVLVGSKKSVAGYVRNDTALHRYGRLAERLISEMR